jgi:Nif-specific regulatory protein
MHAETRALISPSPADLPILYEAGRLLARCPDPGEALASLLSLLAEGLSLSEGLAAARPRDESGDSGLIIRAVAAAGDRDLLGRALDLESLESGRPLVGLMAKTLEGEGAGGLIQARPDGTGGAVLFAAPAIAEDMVVAVLAFRLGEGRGEAGEARAKDMVGAVAALFAEAWTLRAQVAEEGRLQALSDEAPQAAGQPLPPRAARGQGGRGRGHHGPSPSALGPLGPLLGNSQAMVQVRAFIERVAPSPTTVLITGESGTGKELAARAIHGLSAQAGGPFVAVNCAALPSALIESELFGHERGAFTGAHNRRLGRFELAAGGTIFLDEVAELPLDLQAKLLRVLQERTFERVGGTALLSTDARVLAATNRDLEREVVESRFRADLYWRLNVFPLRMPPLRERGGDVVLLADYFTEEYAASTHRPVCRISTPALDLLTSYHWPGNVRELENAIERAVILSNDGVIHAYHLPPSLQSAQSTGTVPGSTLDAALARLERELLVEALKIEGGNAAAAARRLGVSERRIGLALRRYGIDWRRYRTRT